MPTKHDRPLLPGLRSRDISRGPPAAPRKGLFGLVGIGHAELQRVNIQGILSGPGRLQCRGGQTLQLPGQHLDLPALPCSSPVVSSPTLHQKQVQMAFCWRTFCLERHVQLIDAQCKPHRGSMPGCRSGHHPCPARFPHENPWAGYCCSSHLTGEETEAQKLGKPHGYRAGRGSPALRVPLAPWQHPGPGLVLTGRRRPRSLFQNFTVRPAVTRCGALCAPGALREALFLSLRAQNPLWALGAGRWAAGPMQPSGPGRLSRRVI